MAGCWCLVEGMKELYPVYKLLGWIQPFFHLQIVVLVEGEIEGKVSIASTASEYPLAIFRIFRSIARK
jgi:hypothetical protein